MCARTRAREKVCLQVFSHFIFSLSVLPLSQKQNKTTRRLRKNDLSFIKSEPSFSTKQPVVFNKMTCRFQ